MHEPGYFKSSTLAEFKPDEDMDARVEEIRRQAEVGPYAPILRDITRLFSEPYKTNECADGFTFDHSEGVCDVALRIGMTMGLSNEQLEKLLLAAMAHDIGKLDPEVQAVVYQGGWSDVLKQHPATGLKIIRERKWLVPSAVLCAVLEHHLYSNAEGRRYGGSVEPMVFSDEDKLVAQIIAAADVFQAMTAERPHRAEMHSATAAFAAVHGMLINREIVDALRQCIQIQPGEQLSVA